jgi:hypothetical protein
LVQINLKANATSGHQVKNATIVGKTNLEANATSGNQVKNATIVQKNKTYLL